MARTMGENTNVLKTSNGGSQFVNFTNGTIRVTVLGEKMVDETPKSNADALHGIKFEGDDAIKDAHKMAIYSAELTVPDSGISIPLDNIMGRTRNINDIFNTRGSFAGTTKGTEILNTTDMSLGFTEDYVYLSSQAEGHIISRDVIRAMLLAETFPHGECTIKAAGTNGTVKRGEEALSNRYFGGLFLEDGKLIIPQATDEDGGAILKTNARVAAYNTTSLTVMIEFLYTFSQEKKSGFRFVYILNGGVTYNEADDANKVSTTAQILCDPRAIDNFYISGGINNGRYLHITDESMTIGAALSKLPSESSITGSIIKNPVLVYANIDTTSAGRAGRAVTTTRSGYLLLDSNGNPVPAFISKSGSNPVLEEAATALDNLVSDYIFNIYDYNMNESKFVEHYYPAQASYVPSSIIVRSVEREVAPQEFKIKKNNK